MKSLSLVRLFETPWTHQAPPSMGFSRQEYWSGLPFPSPADLPDPGIEPSSPTLQADALTSEPDPNTEQDREVTAAVQNATQGYRVLYEERNRAATQASMNPFFQRVDGVDPGRDQRPSEWPAASPSCASDASHLFSRGQPPVPALYILMVLHCKIKTLYFLWVFINVSFVWKLLKPVTEHCAAASYVSGGPGLALLDLQICSQAGTHSCIEYLLYSHTMVCSDRLNYLTLSAGGNCKTHGTLNRKE